MLFIRPAGPKDLPALQELAVLSGAGFTSLPEDEAVLAERLKLAEASFSGAVAPAEAWYTLMLEDHASGTVAGVAGVRSAVGLKRPHFSFRVVTLAQYSAAIETRFDHQALVLVNECSGWTEVGSLFLRPEWRSGGAGRLLAQSRYMLIATDPFRFSGTIMAELRGRFDEDDRSPFWEGVASKFFRLPFGEADRMVTMSDGQFILDLAPRSPIYVELIEDRARDAIGQVHRDGEAAKTLLECEGFGWSGLIDIFDGGPTMICPRDQLSTIRSNRLARIEIGSDIDGVAQLLANDRIDDFRATRSVAASQERHVVIDAETADALKLHKGDVMRIQG